MRIESGKRALNFKEKKRTSSNELFKECLVEIEKDKQNRTRWEVEREMYFRRNGMTGREIKRMRERRGTRS